MYVYSSSYVETFFFFAKFNLSLVIMFIRLRPRDDVVVRASAMQLVNLGVISLVELYQKTSKSGFRSFPAWRSAFKRGLWRTSRQVCLLCPLTRHLTGCTRSLAARA